MSTSLTSSNQIYVIYTPSVSAVGPGLIYLAINDRSSIWVHFGCACAVMIFFLKARTQLFDVTIMNAILSQQMLVPCHGNRLKSSGQEDYGNDTPQLMCQFQSLQYNV